MTTLDFRTRAFAFERPIVRPSADDDDRLFRDYIEDISVTKEELAAIVRRPDLSIPEVKRILAHGSPAPQTRLAAYAAAVFRALGDLTPRRVMARLHSALSPSAIRGPVRRNRRRRATFA